MPELYTERIAIAPLRFRASDAAPGGETPIELPFSYRDREAASYLRASVTVPEAWAGGRVGLFIEITGGEPLLFVNGAAYQALGYNHADVLLTDAAAGGETHSLVIEIYAGTAGADVVIKSAELVRIDREVWRARYEGVAAIQDAAAPFGIVCVGHSHLDLAYLWALTTTRKKVGRTWATALRLMDEYPDFYFTQSQPFLYDICRTDYPDLWARLKARVAEGRWETTGAMWVEPDVNIPSGESLIRQVLVGQNFYKREFGDVSRVAWLPDTFGFTASLPQILAQSGVRYLLTSKLSWSDTNDFPHDTFRWRGTDGSEVLTYFVTAPNFHDKLKKWLATYNGTASPDQLRGAWNRYKHQAINREILACVGYGDGGGGATRDMIETIGAYDNARFGRADAFFDRLDAKRDRFPVWRGELYLEYHRGTLTSQAWLKRANRVCETLLRNAEIFAVLSETETGTAYPRTELDAAWRILLTNQFHDILAGTVVPQAIADARRDMAQVEETASRLLDNALQSIAGRVRVKDDSVIVFNPTDTLRPADVVRVTVPNTVIKAMEFADASGAILPSQYVGVDKKGNRDYLVLLSDIGAMGYQTIGAFKATLPQEESTVTAQLNGDTATLENDFVRVTVNRHGEVTAFVHKIDDGDDETPDAVRERDVLAAGAVGNALAVYTDTPATYDAWNIDRAAFDTRTDLSDIATVERFGVIETGTVRAGIVVTQAFRDSRLTQRIFLYAHSPRLEVQTVVDWHEKQTLLCVHFPVAVNADFATYEVQHGVFTRPTTANTTWEAAQFEVPHHRFMDISEGDYGVSLLNDCKYGGAVKENDLRLTLIKSGIYPDPGADQGEHVFTYALLPHTGDYRNETVDEAHAINYPLLSAFVKKTDKRESPALDTAYALASVNDQGLIIDAIKKAEDDNGYIVRLYEAFNTRGTATLTLGFDVAKVYRCNSMEENAQAVAVTGGGDIAVSYLPHEVISFRIVPAPR